MSTLGQRVVRNLKAQQHDTPTYDKELAYPLAHEQQIAEFRANGMKTHEISELVRLLVAMGK